MTDTERQLLTNILGHLRLAIGGLQAAGAQLKMAEDKLQHILTPPKEKQ